MKISERTVKRLGEIITGDKGISSYRGGPKLVSFFNECGTNHTYGQGFPSRWMFAEDRTRQFNDTPTMKKVILSAVDPRDFMGATVYDKETKQEKPANLQDAVTYLDEFLAFDGYEIVPHGKSYDVVDKKRGEIVVDVKLEPVIFRTRSSWSWTTLRFWHNSDCGLLCLTVGLGQLGLVHSPKPIDE